MFIASHRDVYLENEKLMLNFIKDFEVKLKGLDLISIYSNAYILEVMALNHSYVSL